MSDEREEFFYIFLSSMYLPNELALGRSDVMPLLKTFLKGQNVGKYPLNTRRGQFIIQEFWPSIWSLTATTTCLLVLTLAHETGGELASCLHFISTMKLLLISY